MKKRITLPILLLITICPIFSIDFTADYIDGILDVREGSGWYEVYIGDSLPQNAIVRLDSDSYAELTYGNDKIKLSRPGTYELRKLLGSKNEVASSGMGSMFSGKFRTLIHEDRSKTETAVGGVRAAEAETSTINWMSSETSELIADGRDALDSGNFSEAADFFNEAWDFAADSYEESEALYFLGLTSAMSGNYSKALKSLDNIEIEKDSEYYNDFYLLKGQILIESFAWDEAYVFLSDYEASAGKDFPQKLQEYYFMYAVAANNNGKVYEAREAISKLISVDSGSETAKAAKIYRNSL